jgi:hypothetical protein
MDAETPDFGCESAGDALTPEERSLAAIPLWLIRAEMEANGALDADYLIAVTQARIKAQSLQQE